MIPKNIEAVTNSWLSEVLGGEVSGHAVTQIGQGVGLMGDIFRVALETTRSADLPASVVVKLPSSFEENRAQGVALGAVCHAVGTSKALQMGEVQGALATVGLGLNGILTAVILPVIL